MKMLKEHIINSLLSVGLFDDGRVHAVIAGEPVIQCAHVFLAQSESNENTENIDQIIRDSRNNSRADDKNHDDQVIDKETALIGHSSNIQAWAERGYDSRLIAVNVARPILAALSKHGDDRAKRAYLASVLERWLSGNVSTRTALREFNSHELKCISDENKKLRDAGESTYADPDEIDMFINVHEYVRETFGYDYHMTNFIIDPSEKTYADYQRYESSPRAYRVIEHNEYIIRVLEKQFGYHHDMAKFIIDGERDEWIIRNEGHHHITINMAVGRIIDDHGGEELLRKGYEMLHDRMTYYVKDHFSFRSFVESLRISDPSDAGSYRANRDLFVNSLIVSSHFDVRGMDRWGNGTHNIIALVKDGKSVKWILGDETKYH